MSSGETLSDCNPNTTSTTDLALRDSSLLVVFDEGLVAFLVHHGQVLEGPLSALTQDEE